MTAVARTTATARYASTSSQPTLRMGSKGAAVTQLQQKLKAAGFNPGAADGDFGPKTLAAVQAFQRARGLAADGVVGPATWGKLGASGASGPAPSSGGSPQPTIRQGSKGAAVTLLQQKLKGAGFNPGAVDGDFGPGTAAAVRSFQRAKGLSADGVVGPATWGKLGLRGSGVAGPSAPGGGSSTVGYVNGVARNITLSGIPNGKQMRTDAAAAYNRMYAAARSDGVTLTPVSGFRTMEQQRYLYSLYLQGRGNLAARPGYSNHQGGIAVDISTNSAVNNWLANHAAAYGFRRTVPSEIWHFEYRP